MQKTVTITVCDVCGDEKRQASSYAVTKDSKTVEKELCATHAAPLEVLLGNRKRTGRPPAKKATASRITSIEEIEAKKAAAKKATVKKATARKA